MGQLSNYRRVNGYSSVKSSSNTSGVRANSNLKPQHKHPEYTNFNKQADHISSGVMKEEKHLHYHSYLIPSGGNTFRVEFYNSNF